MLQIDISNVKRGLQDFKTLIFSIQRRFDEKELEFVKKMYITKEVTSTPLVV